MKDELIKYRRNINKIDRKMKKLFLKRMDISKKIGKYKELNNLDYIDKNRELELKKELINDINKDNIKDLYLKYLNNIIDLSVDLQTNNHTIIYDTIDNIKSYYKNKEVLLITDKNVYNLYNNKINKLFNSNEIYIIEPGEQSKNINNILDIIKLLIDKHYSRNSLIIGLGGGVITDLSGMIASIYKRGIDLILVPTTLLSMVDASIGMKNGINFLDTKNLIGTYKQACKTIIDFSFLKTLDKRIYNEGIFEIIKIFLAFSKDDYNNLLNNNLKEEDMIKKAIKLKQNIVMLDPYDKSLRHGLNFGHTIGHAIESCSLKENNILYHGESIAYGMLYFIDEKIKPSLFSTKE